MAEKEKEKDILEKGQIETVEKAENALKDSLKFENFVSKNGDVAQTSEKPESQEDKKPSDKEDRNSDEHINTGVTAEEFQKLQEEYKETKELLLRVAADFENYKKRVAKEKEEIVKYANESILKELLDTADNLELTLLHSQSTAVKSEDLIKGFEITLKGFMEILKRFGVVPLDMKDNLFDPNFHEAISAVESNDIPAGHIVKIERKGYMLRDRLLRPALVVVSKGAPSNNSDAPEVEDKPLEHICIAEPEPEKNNQGDI